MKAVKNFPRYLKSWISNNKVLAGILTLAAFLRFWGLYPGFPSTHPDEAAIYGTAVKMILHLTYDPMRYDYAALPMIIHMVIYFIINPFFIVYSFIFSPDNLPRFKNVLDFYQQILWINTQTSVLYWGRFITVVVGVGIVFMVYQVAVKYFSNKAIGLSAAFLTAVNFRQVLNSRIILPDIYNAFFLLLCFYVLANLLQKPNRKNYLLTGAIIGLYMSVKFHVFSIPALFLVHLLGIWASLKKHTFSVIYKNRKNLLKKLFRLDFIAALVLVPIIFVIVNPFLFLHLDNFISMNTYQARQYRLGINNLDIYPISYLYHIGIGRIISISILLGILWGFRKYTTSTLILFSAIGSVFYFLIYYGNGGFYTRNFVSITPLVLIFAGLFIVEISRSVGGYLKIGKRAVNLLTIALLALASWGQFNNTIVNSYNFSQPQSFKTAKNWAENNIPEGSTVALRSFDRFHQKYDFKRVNFEYSDTYSLAEMQEREVDYGYIALDELNLYFYWWMKQDTREGLAYWDKSVPDSISQNMYAAKVAQELASWSVAPFIKPWQSPDVNYFAVKVPPKMELGKKKTITKFTFDNEDELSSWFLIRGYEGKNDNIILDQSVGNNNAGAVRFRPAGAFPNIIRAVSPIIPLGNSDKKRAYELTGWIKTGTILNEKEKDGFLEIDFYQNDPQKISLTTKSISASLSSRVFGANEWVKKEITVVAPNNAKFMTVSLGINDYRTTIWFDDITISESEETYEDPRTISPYSNYQIPRDILFPVSHGNL